MSVIDITSAVAPELVARALASRQWRICWYRNNNADGTQTFIGTVTDLGEVFEVALRSAPLERFYAGSLENALDYIRRATLSIEVRAVA